MITKRIVRRFDHPDGWDGETVLTTQEELRAYAEEEAQRYAPPKAQWKHDCDACKFLGKFGEHDLYVCSTSILARYGNDGPAYLSADRGMPVRHPALVEAQRRAQS